MGKAKLIFWDVQHGSAASIVTPGDKLIAVDLGTGRSSDSSFSPLRHLHSQGIRRLDALVITHPHRDHLGDIASLETLPARVLATPPHLTAADIRGGNKGAGGATIERYIGLTERYSRTPSKREDPFDRKVNGGLHLRIFTPTRCPKSDLNDHSLVLVASYAGFKVVIPGDNEECSWRELLADKDFRRAIKGTHVLVAPHHGRRSGFSRELCERITPRLVIISDGPVSGTSATDLYRSHTHQDGWMVEKRRGGREKRRCLTTRKDGPILIEISEWFPGIGRMRVRVD